jgi:hypothetical protein
MPVGGLMATITVLTTESVTNIDGAIEDAAVLVAIDAISEVFGWELKPEGLCRGDVCVPVRQDAGVRHGDRVDLVTIAALLGSLVLVDPENRVVAVSVPVDQRRSALRDRRAPDFALPDLNGDIRTLEEFKDRKRLLVAFASW